MKNGTSIQSRKPGRAVAASPRRQRGAAAVFAAIAGLAAIIAMLLAINVGQMYYSKRDLQKLAALSALAGAEVGSGCSNGGVPGTLAQVTAAVKNALQTNNLSAGEATGVMSGFNNAPAVELGRIDSSSGKRLFVALVEGDPRIDSVRVNFTRAAASIIGGYTPGPSPTLQASATAQQPALGNFSIDTGLLTLDTNNSALLGPLLQGLLGTKSQIDVNLVNSSGILNAKVSLAGLEAAAGVTNLHDLLNLNTNLTGALNILGQALSGTAGGLVSGLAGQAYNGDGGPVRNYFGDLFNNAGGQLNPLVTDAASLVPFVNATDLLTALGEDAGKNQPITIQTNNGLLSLLKNLPGVSLKLFLQVTAPPQFSVPGPAGPLNTAHSAQITLNVRINVDLDLLVVKLATLNLGVDLEVPSATGTLTSLQCPTAGAVNPIAMVDATTAVAKLTAGSFDPSQTFPALGSGNLLTVLNGLITVTVKQNPAPPVFVGSQVVHTTGPYDTYTASPLDSQHPHQTSYTAVPPDNTDTIGSSGLLHSAVNSLLGGLLSSGPSGNLQIKVAGLDLGGLAAGLISALNAVLTPLTAAVDLLLDSLLQLLGIQVGTATVQMQTVLIGQPVVVTSTLAGATGN